MREALVKDGVVYCDFRVQIYGCELGDIYSRMYWANIGFFFFTVPLGIYLIYYRKFIRKSSMIINRRLGALDGVIIGCIINVTFLGVYAALMLSNVWGNGYFIVREAFFIFNWVPALTGVINYVLRITEAIPNQLVSMAHSKVFENFKFIERFYYFVTGFFWLWAFFPGLVTGYYHDLGNDNSETLSFQIDYNGVGILAVILSSLVFSLGNHFVLILGRVLKTLQGKRPTTAFMTPAEISNEIVIQSGEVRVVYNEKRLKHDIMRTFGLNLIISGVLMLYGLGCFFMANLDSFFVTPAFTPWACVSTLNGSNVAVSVTFFVLLIYDIRSQGALELERTPRTRSLEAIIPKITTPVNVENKS